MEQKNKLEEENYIKFIRITFKRNGIKNSKCIFSDNEIEEFLLMEKTILKDLSDCFLDTFYIQKYKNIMCLIKKEFRKMKLEDYKNLFQWKIKQLMKLF